MALHDICILLFPRFQLLDVSGPLEVFAAANSVLCEGGGEEHYRVALRATAAGEYRSSSGIGLQARGLPRRGGRIDTAIVPGGPGAWLPEDACDEEATAPLVRWVQDTAPGVGRIASVCTGAFVLGRAGVLDGRRAVTHWLACDALARRFATVAVQPDAIYHHDGPVWTSAGVTAGIDMALAMVQKDLGHSVAMAVAKRLVVFFKRPGGQSQFSSALLEQASGDERVEHLHAWIRRHLRRQLTVDDLAAQLAMTPRTFARFYRASTGTTPAQAVLRMRLERACALLEQRPTSVKEVARQCGFSSDEIMRRAFLRHLHVAPAEYRARFRG